MPTHTKLTKTIITISKIFLIGLLLQFFLQTFITYGLGFSGTVRNIVWMRKEIVILVLFGILIFLLSKYKLRRQIPLKGFIFAFIGILLITFIINIFVVKTGIANYAMSIRYSMTGFLIFIIFFGITFIQPQEETTTMRYVNKMVKKILIGGLIWRGLLRLVPGLVEHAGYNIYGVEGEIGKAPPLIYHTQYNEGYIRNQFLFERPISLGFFLVALFPLFFMLVIKNKGWKNLIRRGGLYGLVVLSTFSRAARGARFVQIIIIFFLEYRKDIKKIFLYGILPLLILFGIVTYMGKDQIINREYSNLGHIYRITEAINIIKTHPLRGLGAGSAGPASYQVADATNYNPENQFFQIWIEYGIFGFLGRVAIYLYLHFIGIKAYKTAQDEKNIKKTRFYGYLVFACSLGLLGLSIEGLVLHSFVDRMIVYPFMAIFGMIYATYIKQSAPQSHSD